MNMDSSSYSDPTLEQMITQHNLKEEFSDQIRRLARNGPCLTELDLCDNRIEATGAAALSQALSFNSTLAILDLCWNEIGDIGAASIAQALSLNYTLTALNLSRNEMGDTGAAAISQALSSNSSLTTLDLSNNCISKILELSIFTYMETNKYNKMMHAKTLQQLCCSALSSADIIFLNSEFPFVHTLYFPHHNNPKRQRR